jgi:hypothetical protein
MIHNGGRCVDLVSQKDVRAVFGLNQIRVDWEQAQQQADGDLRSVHCTRKIEALDTGVTSSV